MSVYIDVMYVPIIQMVPVVQNIRSDQVTVGPSNNVR